MKLLDAFRAQYFLSTIENELIRVEKEFYSCDCFSKTLYVILQEFSSFIAVELDQLLLPTITFEIHKAKEKGSLVGLTPEERYKSFFVDDKAYTKHARLIIDKYPLLFEMIDKFIFQTFDSLALSLKRYLHDQIELRIWLDLPDGIKILQIEPLSGADRHQSQQALLFTFSNDLKMIYKPVDLSPDFLMAEFISKLDLPTSFALKGQDVLSKKSYGWIKFIQHQPCQNLREVENFYRRAGILLSIADALNYTDGHCENLIASGAFPILIDCETLFQNYEQTVIVNKSILTTLLVQKIDNDNENQFLNSALQASYGTKYEYFQTHALQDHTDQISISYCGINPTPHHHCPVLKDKVEQAHDYVSYIIEGYRFGYGRITAKVENILSDQVWWETLSKIKARILLRETVAYLYLLRKIQQPDGVTSRKKTKSILLEKLGMTPYSTYEMEELLNLNIPYFYHIPGQRHLYDGNGHEYSNTFSENGIDRLKKQFLARSDKKMHFDCEILSRHLIPSFADED